MRNVIRILVLCVVCMLLCSCEKAYEKETVSEQDANVIIRVSNYQQLSFEDITYGNGPLRTRSAINLYDYCPNIQFFIFDGSEKVSILNQSLGDEGYGQANMNIAPGSYTLMVLAHKGLSFATVTSLQKVTFPSNQVGDTFYYCGSITVEDNKQNTFSISLERCVAMFRLCTDDPLPDNVTKMKFYYTGGSSTLDASRGWGNVNSRQTVNFDIEASQHGKPATFEVFTFPHEDGGKLKITVTALDAEGKTIKERIFENVPIQRKQITQYTGTFFGSEQQTNSSMTIQGDTTWVVFQHANY